ncbi:MAG: polysaccharide deacetylase family protein, partial [Chloroflexi bacterium]|nr:polysaccharide deacetylase family protein [Chloroflexota bacterium]
MPRTNLILLTLILTACATPAPLPTVMPVPTVLPTPTFAPTLTPAPTVTPTLAPTFAPTATATIAVPLIITRDANAFSREATVPILMYHYIEPVPPDNKDQLRADLTVTPEKFESQLKFLKERGYTSIDLYQFYGALARGDKLPAKPIVITFDDGYGDLHEYAFPLMQKYGFAGTIFMITDFTDAQKPEYIVWAKALEMARAGWRLESHTKTHPSLEGQSVEFQRDQLKG